MDLSYGYEIKPSCDPYVTQANVTLENFKYASGPAGSLLRICPFCKLSYILCHSQCLRSQ